MIEENDNDALWTECNEISKFNVEANHFAEKFPDYTISGYNEETKEKIHIKEFAPKIFRNIRKKHLTEDQLLHSFVPNLNMSGMYNFRTGGGKSPSFFYFPDNNRLMLKTLKDSEHDIIFNKGFLLEYFKYLYR
jgi:hypothetical protein